MTFAVANANRELYLRYGVFADVGIGTVPPWVNTVLCSVLGKRGTGPDQDMLATYDGEDVHSTRLSFVQPSRLAQPFDRERFISFRCSTHGRSAYAS